MSFSSYITNNFLKNKEVEFPLLLVERKRKETKKQNPSRRFSKSVRPETAVRYICVFAAGRSRAALPPPLWPKA
jgi:hypothetical protein